MYRLIQIGPEYTSHIVIHEQKDNVETCISDLWYRLLTVGKSANESYLSKVFLDNLVGDLL